MDPVYQRKESGFSSNQIKTNSQGISLIDNRNHSVLQRKLSGSIFNKIGSTNAKENQGFGMQSEGITGRETVQLIATGWNNAMPVGQSKWLKKNFQTDAIRAALPNALVNIRGEIQNYTQGDRTRKAEYDLLNLVGVNQPPANLESAKTEVERAYAISVSVGRVNANTASTLFARIEALPNPDVLLQQDSLALTAAYTAHNGALQLHFTPVLNGIIGPNAIAELLTKPFELQKLTDIGQRLQANVAVPGNTAPIKKVNARGKKTKMTYRTIVDTNVAASFAKSNAAAPMSALEQIAAARVQTDVTGRRLLPVLTDVGVGEFRAPAGRTVADEGFGRMSVSAAHRSGRRYNAIYDTLRNHGVGAVKGVMDASMVADAFISSAGGHRTEFITGDADVIVGLASIKGMPQALPVQQNVRRQDQPVNVVNRAKIINLVTGGQFDVTIQGLTITVKTVAEAPSAGLVADFNL